MHRIPYPLRAASIVVRLIPFGNWLQVHWHYRKHLTETAREQGETIWWLRIGPVQFSYNRML